MGGGDRRCLPPEAQPPDKAQPGAEPQAPPLRPQAGGLHLWSPTSGQPILNGAGQRML